MTFYDFYNDDKFKEVEYAQGTDWEGIICPEYKGHQRAGDRIGKLRINIKSKNFGDFLWTFLSECIINDNVVEVLKANRVSGYEIKEVEICNRSLPYKLWELIVTGKGGDADGKSGIHLKEECIYCKSKTYSAYENGIIVDEKNWDGNDIFTVNGYTLHFLTTERVKTLIEKNKLKGVIFTPSHELKWPEGVIKP